MAITEQLQAFRVTNPNGKPLSVDVPVDLLRFGGSPAYDFELLRRACLRIIADYPHTVAAGGCSWAFSPEAHRLLEICNEEYKTLLGLRVDRDEALSGYTVALIPKRPVQEPGAPSHTLYRLLVEAAIKELGKTRYPAKWHISKKALDIINQAHPWPVRQWLGVPVVACDESDGIYLVLEKQED